MRMKEVCKKIDEIIKNHDKVFTEDPEVSMSMFAAKNEIDINGRKVYLAIKTSYDQKLTLVVKLCKELNIARDAVRWYDGEKELLWQDND